MSLCAGSARAQAAHQHRFDLPQTVMITARILFVAIPTGVIARLVWALLNSLAGTSLFGQIISVGAAVVVAAGFYVWAISHMRVPEWQQIESMLMRRLRPR